MTPSLYRRLLGVVFTIAVAGHLSAQAPAGHSPTAQGSAPGPSANGAPQAGAGNQRRNGIPAGAWWRTESFRKEIGLTADEQTRLDHIWLESEPRLREDYIQLNEREDKLSRLIEKNADEQAIAAQIDRVEAMRGTLNKERQLMLVHMRAVLTPEQRVKFNDRWVRFREQQQQPAQRSPQGSSNAPSGAAPGQRPAPPSGTPPTRRPE